MKTLFILALAATVVYSIVRSYKKSDATKLTWAGVARAKKLEFRGAGLFSRPSISGIHDGYRVAIDTVTRGGGKSNRTYTRYRVHYQKLGVRIRLTREVPVLSTLGKFFGGEDHRTGDAGFDDTVIVRAPHEQKALRYLTPRRRKAIATFLSKHKNAVITDRNATFETLGLESRAQALGRGLSLLIETARALDPDAADAPEAGDAHEPPPLPARVPPPTPVRDAAVAVTAALPALTPGPPPPPPPASDPEPAPEEAVDPEPHPEPEPRSALDPEIEIEAEAPPVAAEDEPPSPPATGGRQQDVCEALFAENGGLSRAKDIFEAEYANLFVHWTGTLKSARHYYSDLVFGSDAGTRAEVVVARVASGILGEREVVAVVQLPDGAHESLAPRVGEEVTFEGDLASVDPFMRNVFVRGAALTD